MADIRDEHDWEVASFGENQTYSGGGLLASPGPLRPLVDFVASIRVGVFPKLLTGFLIGALLLLAMGILSLWVIDRMSGRATELNALSGQLDLARQMEYSITAQSHFRAMALICESAQSPPASLYDPDDCTADPPWNDRIANAKGVFAANLARVEGNSSLDQSQVFTNIREVNDRFSVSSAKALGLYQQGNITGALRVHIEEEHPISHKLEDAIDELEVLTTQDMQSGVAAIQADDSLLFRIVVVFGAVSIGLALFLGFVLSWSFVGPVRRMGQAMSRIASGDFSQPVRVANRDELGDLATRINQTAEELAKLQEATLAEERARALQERITQVTLAQEEERRRISRELHDGLGPSLAAIGNRLSACQYLVSSDPERAKRDLEEVTKTLRGHIQEVRELTHGLRPPALDQLGLIAALSQHVERFGQETGITASFSTSGEVALNPLVEVTIFRVIQECLSNVQKHANATQVEVRLQGVNAGVEVKVQDDGRGFDPHEASPTTTGRGVGLLGMHERAELLAGNLSVQSSAGSGCLVTLFVPSQEVEVGTDTNPPC